MLERERILTLFSATHGPLDRALLCISDQDRQDAFAINFRAQEMVNTYSVSKIIVTLAIYSLWENDLIDLRAPIAHYWPEFAQEGKADITISHVMNHTSGVPHFGEALETADTYDWFRVCALLERTTPLHRAGQATVYHARSFGFLLGEIIRRVTGLPFSDYVSQHLTFGESSFYFGVPVDRMADVLPLSIPGDLDQNPTRYQASGAQPIPHGTAPYAATVFQNPVNAILAPNDPLWLRAVIPSSGGVSNASMIVDIMKKFFQRHPRIRSHVMTLTKKGNPPTLDLALGFPLNWIGGFGANNGEFGRGDTRFGYRAVGGSFAFFDLHHDLFVSYTTALMLPQPGRHPAHDPRIEQILTVT